MKKYMRISRYPNLTISSLRAILRNQQNKRLKMTLFVPLIKNMIGDNAPVGVFLSRENAQNHLDKIKYSGNIITTTLPDDSIIDNTVYLASYYVEIGDQHAYKGVYADFETAKKEAGEYSEVLAMTPR